MLKRRHFLQLTGSTAATIGLSQWDLARSTQMLAKDAPRKLALLVGINAYAEGTRGISSLNGCKNDVRLQTELLVHRFGFDPKNIVTLIDAEATRQNILQKFETHLIAQAQPGDVVVFHFSGHGSRLIDPNPIANRPFNSAFLPFDAGDRQADGSVNDIMGRTLFLLVSALRTENVTVVLDSCHSGGGTRGQVKIRSAPESNADKPSRAELDYQAKWQDRLKLTLAQVQALRQAGVAKGVVLAAALAEQTAEDRRFTNDFSAGTFTYILTQLLWQQSATLNTAQPAIASQMIQLNGYQEPVFDRSPNLAANSPLFFTPPLGRSSQAVVTAVKQDQATLWLGGLNPDTIEAFSSGSTFALLDAAGESNGKVTLKSRNGLTAIATVEGQAKAGSLLREIDRVIPNDFRLRLGVDPSLSAELTTIQAQLQSLGRLQVQALNPSEPVDYILSRITPAYAALLKQNTSAIGSIVLFKPNLELLPNASSPAGSAEPLPTALKRLTPTLQSLVAAQLVRQTLNATSSTLKVAVTVAPVDRPAAIVAQAGTLSAQSQEISSSPSLPLNTPFQLQLTNQNAFPLYFLVLLVNPNGQLETLFPNLYTLGDLTQIAQVGSQSQRVFPDPQQGDRFKLSQDAIGRSELLVIASPKPLTTAFRRLQTLSADSKRGQASDAIDGLLEDTSRSRTTASSTIGTGDLATVSIRLNFGGKNP